ACSPRRGSRKAIRCRRGGDGRHRDSIRATMNLVVLLSLLGFIVLTLGTAVFVCAEFSLTALERSTVDAHARAGVRRDRLLQRAHKTLSFQLSGAQIGISITTLITGYLAEPLIARLLRPVLHDASVPPGWVDGIALA